MFWLAHFLLSTEVPAQIPAGKPFRELSMERRGPRHAALLSRNFFFAELLFRGTSFSRNFFFAELLFRGARNLLARGNALFAIAAR
jgi:hypothetical protein